MKWRIAAAAALMMLLSSAAAHGQQPDVGCWLRPTMRSDPWVLSDIPCLEIVAEDTLSGALGYTALAVDATGRLYAARPEDGAVYTFDDSDGDGIPETARLLADGLEWPGALAVLGDDLYVRERTQVTRLADGVRRVVVSGLPARPGQVTGALAAGEFGTDGPRLVIALGPSCADCADPVARYGALISTDPDGADQRVLAYGLDAPYKALISDGELWLSDGDSLFRLPAPNGDDAPGWLRCPPDAAAGCTPHAPWASFETGTRPLGFAPYDGDVIPVLDDTLTLALGGSRHGQSLVGYELLAIDREDPEVQTRIMPATSDQVMQQLSAEAINWRGLGPFPAQIYDVAVTPLGWVYLSIGGGRIYAFRPEAPAT